MQSWPRCLWKLCVVRRITWALAHVGLSAALMPEVWESHLDLDLCGQGGGALVMCACRRCESWYPRPPRNGVFCRGNGCQYAEVGREL